MNHPGRKGEVQAVAVATADDLRQRLRRKSKLKGRQPDEKSLAEVVTLIGPRPEGGHLPPQRKQFGFRIAAHFALDPAQDVGVE